MAMDSPTPQYSTITLGEYVAPGNPPVWVMPSYHTSVRLHDHDFYELVYVTEGFCLHDVGGGISLLMEGDLFILPPGICHRYVGNRVTRIYNCLFLPEGTGAAPGDLSALPGLDRLFAPPLEGANPQTPPLPRLHLSLMERKAVRQLLSDMCEECSGQLEGWRLRLCGLLSCLLVDFSRAYQARLGSGEETGAYSAYVSQALSYINLHYAEAGLSVQEVASSVGVTGDYLSRQFRQVTGIPVQEYLRRYRFARSMELLQSEMSVGDVAAAVGFGSLCHFSREFKKELGVTPTQYRAQGRA